MTQQISPNNLFENNTQSIVIRFRPEPVQIIYYDINGNQIRTINR